MGPVALATGATERCFDVAQLTEVLSLEGVVHTLVESSMGRTDSVVTLSQKHLTVSLVGLVHRQNGWVPFFCQGSNLLLYNVRQPESLLLAVGWKCRRPLFDRGDHFRL